MKNNRHRTMRAASLISCLMLVCLIYGAGPVLADTGPEDIWVSAYYAGWMQGCGYKGHLSAEQIDYSAVTHILHFSLMPNPDGSLNDSINCVTEDNSERLLNAAHAAGKKVLISVGCWGTESDFLSATSSKNRGKLISNLLSLMTARGYDGIDIDWEPLSSSSAAQYAAFITELRAALDSITPRPLLTAAVLWEPMVIASVQDKLDQINIMTYEISGPWPGWITWHNAPLYDGGYWFESTGESVPSADGLVRDFLSAGINPNKLGIGIEFYGAVWSGGSGTPTGGATAPAQSWTVSPSVEVIPYFTIMDQYHQLQYYRWDSAALAPYLSIDFVGSTYDKFISYDDETSCVEKIRYVKNKGLGGIMVFELGGGWRPAEPLPDSLLQSIKDAAEGTPVEVPQLPDQPVLALPVNNAAEMPTDPVLTWNVSPQADFYSLQVASDTAFASLVINASGIQGTSFSANGLSPNTRYYWRVRAQNSAGSSEWSMVWNFSTITVCSTVIDDFTGYPSRIGVILTWSTITECNTKRFEIERRSAASASWFFIGSVSGAGTSSVIRTYSFYDKKARKAGTYLYRLKQVNLDGTYTYSQEITVAK